MNNDLFDESQFSAEALDSFYKNGVRAYWEDKNIAENPYPVFTAPYKFWEKGWWETFYNQTTFYIESISINSNDAQSDGFTETSKYGEAQVIDFTMYRKMREQNKK